MQIELAGDKHLDKATLKIKINSNLELWNSFRHRSQSLSSRVSQYLVSRHVSLGKCGG